MKPAPVGNNCELFHQSLIGDSAGLHFTVYGTPIPQGSMKAIQGRHQKFPSLVCDNREKLQPWRDLVFLTARRAWREQFPTLGLINGPVILVARFLFHRPKSHFVNGDGVRLKPTARRSHYVKPDADKLLRAICDGLTGSVIKDDCQVCEYHCRKGYTQNAERCEIHVYPGEA